MRQSRESIRGDHNQSSCVAFPGATDSGTLLPQEAANEIR